MTSVVSTSRKLQLDEAGKLNLSELLDKVKTLSNKNELSIDQPKPRTYVATCSEATGRLRTENSTLITEVISVGDSYYRTFFEFLVGDAQSKVAFANLLHTNCVADQNFMEATIYRATLIQLKDKYSISYELATNLFPLVDIDEIHLSLTDCCEIVCRNYLDMLETDHAHQIVGRFDEDGYVRIIEGHHRAIINIVAGFESTPVLLVAPSRQWQEFVTFFRSEGVQLYGDDNSLYHKIDHPDFLNFSVIREDRSHPIIEAVLKKNLSVGLDLGSMIGFYTHALARHNIAMTAIEFESKYAEKAVTLGKLYQLGDLVDVRCENIYDCSYFDDGNDYDFVLMLSILYHLLRRNESECLEWLESMQQRFRHFIVDTEPRTGILDTQKLFALFPNFDHELLFSGADDRLIFLLTRK